MSSVLNVELLGASALSFNGNKASRRPTQVSQPWTNYHLIRMLNRTLKNNPKQPHKNTQSFCQLQLTSHIRKVQQTELQPVTKKLHLGMSVMRITT